MRPCFSPCSPSPILDGSLTSHPGPQLAKLEKVADRLRAELADLTAALNARIVYFANLQKLSDDVADPDMGHKSWRGLLVETELLRQEERASLSSLESLSSSPARH